MKTKINYWFAFIGILLFAQACQSPTSIDVVRDDIEVAMPLFKYEVSISEFLNKIEDSTTVVISNDSISLVYKSDIVNRSLEDMFDGMPDVKIPLIGASINFPIELLSDVTVNKAIIKEGKIHYRFTNDTTPGPVSVHFTILQLLDGTDPFEIDVVIPDGGGASSFVEDSIDVTGYNLVIADGSLTIAYEAKDENNDPVILPIDSDLLNPVKNYTFIHGLFFDYIEGHWAKNTQDVESQLIQIDFFQTNYINGQVYFEDPKVDFFIENSFGFPVRTAVNFFRVVEADSSVVNMESSLIDSGIDFNYPSMAEVGETKSTHITFDKNNSNIDELLNTSPIRIEYDIDVTINPDNIPDIIGFATDSSFYSMSAIAELPLTVRVTDLVLEQEFDVDFGATEDIKKATLKISTDNELPLATAIQIYFLDINGAILDSLTTAEFALILDAADYPYSSSKHLESEFPLNEQQWSNVKNTKKMRIKGNYTTTDNGQKTVTFLSNQKTTVKVGLKVGF